MFTGIVQAIGKVTALRRQAAGTRLVVDRAGWQPQGLPIAGGDSICVSGVCLTVAAFDQRMLEFDVTAESLARSTLGRLTIGADVNLEPALTPATPLGGHFVQGHVDGVGTVIDVKKSADDRRVTIAPPKDLTECIVPKGSITVEGVSLTVATTAATGFEIALIPTTLALTTLGQLAKGASVNLEADILSKTIVHWLRLRSGGGATPDAPRKDPLTMAALRRAGLV